MSFLFLPSIRGAPALGDVSVAIAAVEKARSLDSKDVQYAKSLAQLRRQREPPNNQ